MDIVTAFGPLKSYHFEINEELNEPCAFLEVNKLFPQFLFLHISLLFSNYRPNHLMFQYMDKSITLKALTGLNGLKLGGQVLIAVKTLLNIHLDENRHEVMLHSVIVKLLVIFYL